MHVFDSAEASHDIFLPFNFPFISLISLCGIVCVIYVIFWALNIEHEIRDSPEWKSKEYDFLRMM